MAGKEKNAKEWDGAKRRCRLNDEDIAMAIAMGMSPRGLMKNIPNQSQRWKAPVRDWIRELHEKRFGRLLPTPPPAPTPVSLPPEPRSAGFPQPDDKPPS